MKNIVLSGALAAMIAVPAPVTADPSFGFGISFIFGGGVAVGGRIFSTDKPQKGALSLGLDYMFGSGAWRPLVGVAYLDDNYYLDFSLGLGTQSGELDYGIGIGGLGGMQSDSPPAPPPSPPPA